MMCGMFIKHADGWTPCLTYSITIYRTGSEERVGSTCFRSSLDSSETQRCESCCGRKCEHGLGVLMSLPLQHTTPSSHSMDREPSSTGKPSFPDAHLFIKKGPPAPPLIRLPSYTIVCPSSFPRDNQCSIALSSVLPGT